MTTITTPINYYRSPLPAELVSSPIPPEALKVLGHALNRQQIPNWKFQVSEMCKTLDMTIYAIKQARKWLLEHGYATYKRIKFRFTVWQFSPVPIPKETAHSPRIIEQVEIPTVLQVEIQPALEVKELLKVKEQQHEPIPEPIQQKTVVVSLAKEIEKPKQVIKEDLKFPDTFTESQVKDAKRTLKRLDMPELAQAILLQLAADILSGAIRTTIPRYLGGLVKTANEQGSFTYAQAAGATNKGGKPSIPYYTAKPQPPTSTRSIGKAAAAAARALLR